MDFSTVIFGLAGSIALGQHQNSLRVRNTLGWGVLIYHDPRGWSTNNVA